jgi:prefoldin subunit 5
MSTNKIDVSTVCEMFEKLSDKLDKQTINKPVEPVQVDLTAVNAMTERLEDTIREVRKPVKVEHRHQIEIASNWVFHSLVGMGLMIQGLSYFIGNQRHTINQYKDNDMKYRYIKMQGHTDEESLFRMEQRFAYDDSVKIIRKQVEKYEKLIKEQTEKIERARQNNEEVLKIQKETESVKRNK